MKEVIPVFLALIGIIAVMIAAMYFAKRLSGKLGVSGRTKGIRIAACTGVGQDKTVMAIKAGKKNLLIGVSSAGINLICPLDEEDMEIICQTSDNSDVQGRSFMECLSSNLKKSGGEIFEKSTADNNNTDDGDIPEDDRF